MAAAQQPAGREGFGDGEVVDRYGIPVFEYTEDPQ
jgi:hypothetical protein